MSVTTLVEELQRKRSRAEHHAKLGSQDETALTAVNPLSWVELHSIIPLESKARSGRPFGSECHQHYPPTR